ncbi:transcription factor UNE10-like isoform X2 [Salvia hispanica]|uniref:transcription factor UNE10-like isoform X2 n=1 Tax=Salvia hispanica TaxID=49212 RepID=UPI0020097EA0|nr:transcription factor UNE10-like isoform X2 [Salvia hispanica]
MNQCVPGWDLDDSTKINVPQGVPSLDYEVAELTWENGQLAMHGLGVPRAGGTLESIVSQATFCPPPPNPTADAKDPAPWSEHHPNPEARTTDAMVPCPNGVRGDASRAGCSSTGSRRVVRAGARSVGESATCGGMSVDTWEREFRGPGFTSPTASMISPGNTISGNDRGCVPLHSSSQRNADEEEGRRRDSGKSSVCTKRNRAAAIHNQSERKRRDKINQKMKTLQKMVPHSSKNDKASMLDEVIEYLKQLQAQVHMMSRMNMNMNMPSMMLPLALQQQQLQMSMMGCMGMGMGVMDMNTIPRPAVPWDNGGDCSAPPQPTAAAASVMPDPLAALLACQNQPLTMDAYSRVAAMYQQLQQQLPGSKN